MLKKISLMIMATMIFSLGYAQQVFKIKLVDEQSNPLPGVTVKVDGIVNTQSDKNGEFNINTQSEKIYLELSMLGYQKYSGMITPSDNLIILQKKTYVSEEVIVSSTRVDDKSAVTFSTITRNDLEKTNLGQDLPYLINQTPSVVITSDAGTGIGYTGIRIRGTDATRTNLTINGIPLNDAESQGTFTVNVPDLASSVDNIQIQRGVGTSTNGAGAFGASINISTDEFTDTAYAELNTTHGSFATDKYTAKVNTGLIGGHWNFSGRLSKSASRGYIDNSSANLKSFFTSASYRDEKHLLKFNVFSGVEKTFLAWNGVNGDSLKTNRTYNGIAAEFPDQYDDYQQDHYQIFESYRMNDKHTFNVGFHFTRGKGYFQEFRFDQSFENYGLDSVINGTDTITSTDILRRRWLRNEFAGVVFSWNYDDGNKLKVIAGGAANQYRGEHFGEIIWAGNASQSLPGKRFYTAWGNKDEISFYTKANYNFNQKLTGFVDAQIRLVDYEITGFNKDLFLLDQKHNFLFFNPKFGVSYNPSFNRTVYLSYGQATKEPNRDDFINGKANNITPKPEQLHNIELGWKQRGRAFSYETNLFMMYYKDQLVLTGEVNNVGEYLRVNTPESYRTGLEVSATYQYSNKLNVSANASYSLNKISSFTESIYEYDAAYNYIDVQLVNHNNTDISFSPSFIAGSIVKYRIIKDFYASLESKYVGKQYMDNTQNESRSIDAFFVNDLFVDYTFKLKNTPRLSVILKVNNLLDVEYVSNGYTYGGVIDGQESRSNFYYPQATRNYLLGVNMRF